MITGRQVNRWSGAVALFAGVLLLAGCQTGRGKEEEPAAPRRAFFAPATRLSHLHFQGGPYENLFAPSSYALWMDEAATAYRRQESEATEAASETEAEAAQIAKDYVVVECRIESVFSDMSIAYDVVGFRGVDVYLTTPDGRRINPVQVIVDSHATEDQEEALKRFGRTNHVVFPKYDLWVDQPTVAESAPSARLVLEAHNSVFYFEWPTAHPATATWQPVAEEAVALTKMGFAEFHKRVRLLAHIFD